MLILFGYILISLGLVVGVPRTSIISNYNATIDNYILKSVKKTAQSSGTLDLSHQDLAGIDRRAFDGLGDVEILNLDHNYLTSLPEFIFWELPNLKNLTLKDNSLARFNNVFLGLKSLMFLEIRSNRIQVLRPHSFEGLDRNLVIILADEKLNVTDISLFEEAQSGPLILVCRNGGGKVKSVDSVVNATNYHISQMCSSVNRVTITHGVLRLNKLNITGFAKRWYNLGVDMAHSLDLSDNKINGVTATMLNYLPKTTTHVFLMRNPIEILRTKRIINTNLIHLDLTNCSITEIEANFMSRTNITKLTLSQNKLTNTSFVETLPSSLEELRLDSNMIDKLVPYVLANLNELKVLSLDHNRISNWDITETDAVFMSSMKLKTLTMSHNELTNISFVGNLPSSLEELRLDFNMIDKLVPYTFTNLKKLEVLNLDHNLIGDLDKGVFYGLNNIVTLSIAFNTIKNISHDSFYGLPEHIKELSLAVNNIMILKVATFVNILSGGTLDISNNNITEIEGGAFNMPELENLYMTYNKLTNLKNDTFVGLPKLMSLDLSFNLINTAESGAFKYLPQNVDVALGFNPINNNIKDNSNVPTLPTLGK